MRGPKLFFLAVVISNYLFAQSGSLAKIPFSLEGNHIFIKVKVNGSEELDFMFDTGMTVAAINTDIVTNLNLSHYKKIKTGGASGKFDAKRSKNNEINLGGLKLTKIDLEEIPLLHLERTIGRDIDGLIGFSLLNKYVVKVNYDSLKLEIYPTNKFEYTGDGEVIDLTVGKLSFIKTQLKIGGNKEVSGEFILDTGAGLALALATPFSQINQIEKKMGRKFTMNVAAYGEDKVTANIGLMNQVQINQFQFKDVPTTIFKNPKGVFSRKFIGGVIGNELLKKFNITFDYKHKKSYWEPNKSFSENSFTTQCSGLVLSLDKTKKRVIIENIIPESVGYESELNVDDIILEIDAVKAGEAPLFELRKILNQSGKEVKIKYSRRGVENEIGLKLKALI